MVRVMSEVQRITVLWPVGPHGYGNHPVVLASEYDAQRLRADTAEAERDKVVAFAVEKFSKLTSADGSGHADCALAVLRILGRNSDEADRIVNAYKKDRTWRRNDMADKLAAAEQRIAEQNSLLEEMATEMTLAISDSQIRSAMTVIGRTRFLQILQAHNARIDAALNQKSEGESHE